MFRDLAADAGSADPGMLATHLQLIYDGAGLAARMDRRREGRHVGAGRACALLDAQFPAFGAVDGANSWRVARLIDYRLIEPFLGSSGMNVGDRAVWPLVAPR